MSKPSHRGIVVAAVIERHGLILACQRRKGDRHELKWEFPGGKVEGGETPQEALRRELQEELAIESVIGPEIGRYEFAYPHKPVIELIFYRVTEFSSEPQNRIFEQMRWLPASQLPQLDFLDGDVEFVNLLARKGAKAARA